MRDFTISRALQVRLCIFPSYSPKPQRPARIGDIRSPSYSAAPQVVASPRSHHYSLVGAEETFFLLLLLLLLH